MSKQQKYVASMTFAVLTVIAAWTSCALVIYHMVTDECTTIVTCQKQP